MIRLNYLTLSLSYLDEANSLMFCADYITSFLYHSILTAGIKKFKIEEKSPLSPFFVGAISGFLGAASVYPFDFVRQSQNLKFYHSLSTVPYSAAFFGLYFSNRDSKNLKNQCQWALGSSLSACLAEIPFDKAKLKMMGDRRTMIFANGLYIPFSAMMLVMYDKAMQNLLESWNCLEFCSIL